jgi:protein-serine/threonine kinase
MPTTHRLDYAGPEILRGERYVGPPQDIWAFGILSYVLLTGECPFSSASEATTGLAPSSKALLALEERCLSEEGEVGEADEGGKLIDAMELVKRCLDVDVSRRPCFDDVLGCKYLIGGVGLEGW